MKSFLPKNGFHHLTISVSVGALLYTLFSPVTKASQPDFSEICRLDSIDANRLTILNSALLRCARDHKGRLPEMKNPLQVRSTLEKYVSDKSSFVTVRSGQPFMINARLSDCLIDEKDRMQQYLPTFFDAEFRDRGDSKPRCCVIYLSVWFHNYEQWEWESFAARGDGIEGIPVTPKFP